MLIEVIMVSNIIFLKFLFIKPTKLLKELIFIMKKPNKGKVLTQEQAEQKILEIMSEPQPAPTAKTAPKVNKPLN